MKIAMLSPIAWRTPPKHYGPWELVTSMLTEELVKNGIEVTLFATGNSITQARLESICEEGYAEAVNADAKVLESLHISNCMEQAENFDIIHNQFDFLPLTYSGLIKAPMVTTIHGFSSSRILPVYKKYNSSTHFVSISHANRHPDLDYIANIYHGINLENFTFQPNPIGNYLLFLGRIHPDKGTHEAIKIAKKAGMKLIIAGIIQDESYFENEVKPHLNHEIEFIGSVGPEKRNELMQNALAFLHPIHFEEPFGLSVIESMACGTPVIAYAKGSMPELIQNGKNGFLVHDVEGAVAALKNIEKIDRNYCRKYVAENFTQEIMAKNYIKVYNQILD